jgi:hypothetical protein
MAVRTIFLGGTRSGESTEEAKGWINPGLKERNVRNQVFALVKFSVPRFIVKPKHTTAQLAKNTLR